MNSPDQNRDRPPRIRPDGRQGRGQHRRGQQGRGQDLRRSNREDRSRSPEIDDDVTGKELDRSAASQLGTLNEANRRWVARHLVMAGRLVDIDPQLAFQHAQAASRRAGRLALVREAVGLTSYAAGDYAEALRELRTYRRISGDQTHLPVQADCERGLGRPQKALEIGTLPEAQQLTGSVRAEMAMVLAGAHRDVGDDASALQALEIPELELNRAFSFSPRLFDAYADVLDAVGRDEEAGRWRAQVTVAEKALGTGMFDAPEIMDFDDEPEDEIPQVKELLGREPIGPSPREQQTEQAERGS